MKIKQDQQYIQKFLKDLENHLRIKLLQGVKLTYLDMEWSSQLIATFCLHGLHFCIMECVESQVLDFTVILNKEDPKINGWAPTTLLVSVIGFLKFTLKFVNWINNNSTVPIFKNHSPYSLCW